MQTSENKVIRTKAIELYEGIYGIMLNDAFRVKLGIDKSTLLEMEFIIKVTPDELVLRAPLAKDKARSNNASEATGDLQS